jgi:exonuclease III
LVPNPPVGLGLPKIHEPSTFNVVQFNCNGFASKSRQSQLALFLEANNIHVAVLQESKLNATSAEISIANYTVLRKDRVQDRGGGLITLVHHSVSYVEVQFDTSRNPSPHIESQFVRISFAKKSLIISNLYIPPHSSCTDPTPISLEGLLDSQEDMLILGDLNAHNSLWDAVVSADNRGNSLAGEINESDFVVLNDEAPTRIPKSGTVSSPDVSLVSSSLLTSCTWSTATQLDSDHVPIIIQIQLDEALCNGTLPTFVNLRRANWDAYETETVALFAEELTELSSQQLQQKVKQFSGESCSPPPNTISHAVDTELLLQ